MEDTENSVQEARVRRANPKFSEESAGFLPAEASLKKLSSHRKTASGSATAVPIGGVSKPSSLRNRKTLRSNSIKPKLLPKQQRFQESTKDQSRPSSTLQAPISAKQRQLNEAEDQFIQDSLASSFRDAQSERPKVLPDDIFEVDGLEAAIRLGVSDNTSVLLDWNLAEIKLIGKLCKVYFDDDKTWYYARILNYDSSHKRHFVYFPWDDTAEWVSLSEENVLVADDFALARTGDRGGVKWPCQVFTGPAQVGDVFPDWKQKICTERKEEYRYIEYFSDSRVEFNRRYSFLPVTQLHPFRNSLFPPKPSQNFQRMLEYAQKEQNTIIDVTELVVAALRSSAFKVLRGDDWIGMKVRAKTGPRPDDVGTSVVTEDEAEERGRSRSTEDKRLQTEALCVGSVALYSDALRKHFIVFNDSRLQPQWITLEENSVEALLGTPEAAGELSEAFLRAREFFNLSRRSNQSCQSVPAEVVKSPEGTIDPPASVLTCGLCCTECVLEEQQRGMGELVNRCVDCESVFHSYCMPEQLIRFPMITVANQSVPIYKRKLAVEALRQQWKCWNCARCFGCDSSALTRELMAWNFQRLGLESQDVLLCGPCLSNYKHSKEFCVICLRFPADNVIDTSAPRGAIQAQSKVDGRESGEEGKQSDLKDVADTSDDVTRQEETIDDVTKNIKDENSVLEAEGGEGEAPAFDGEEAMVNCHECDRWIHALCEGIDAEQYAAISAGSHPVWGDEYLCPLCRQGVTLRVLRKIESADRKGIFALPVTEKEAEHYFDMIRNPMDLLTMREKASRGDYKSLKSLRQDFELMSLNALRFNSQGDLYWQLAMEFFVAGTSVFLELSPSPRASAYGVEASGMVQIYERQMAKQRAEQQQLQQQLQQQQQLLLQQKVSGRRVRHKDALPDDGQSQDVQLPSANALNGYGANGTSVTDASNEVGDTVDMNEEDAKAEDETEADDSLELPQELQDYPDPHSCLSTILTLQTQEEAYFMCCQDLCLICGAGDTCGGPVVFCCDCGEMFHSYCHEIPVASMTSAHAQSWRCSNCKFCVVCKEPSAVDTNLLICESCDEGFHFACVQPSVSEAPDSSYFCANCVQCESCVGRPSFTGAWGSSLKQCVLCFMEGIPVAAAPIKMEGEAIYPVRPSVTAVEIKSSREVLSSTVDAQRTHSQFVLIESTISATHNSSIDALRNRFQLQNILAFAINRAMYFLSQEGCRYLPVIFSPQLQARHSVPIYQRAMRFMTFCSNTKDRNESGEGGGLQLLSKCLNEDGSIMNLVCLSKLVIAGSAFIKITTDCLAHSLNPEKLKDNGAKETSGVFWKVQKDIAPLIETIPNLDDDGGDGVGDVPLFLYIPEYSENEAGALVATGYRRLACRAFEESIFDLLTRVVVDEVRLVLRDRTAVPARMLSAPSLSSSWHPLGALSATLFISAESITVRKEENAAIGRCKRKYIRAPITAEERCEVASTSKKRGYGELVCVDLGPFGAGQYSEKARKFAPRDDAALRKLKSLAYSSICRSLLKKTLDTVERGRRIGQNFVAERVRFVEERNQAGAQLDVCDHMKLKDVNQLLQGLTQLPGELIYDESVENPHESPVLCGSCAVGGIEVFSGWDRGAEGEKLAWQDPRLCCFCRCGSSDECLGRILPFSDGYYAHVNCLRWSAEVTERSGTLLNCYTARERSASALCTLCRQKGATVGCTVLSCRRNFHLKCALAAGMVLMESRLRNDNSPEHDVHTFSICPEHFQLAIAGVHPRLAGNEWTPCDPSRLLTIEQNVYDGDFVAAAERTAALAKLNGAANLRSRSSGNRRVSSVSKVREIKAGSSAAKPGTAVEPVSALVPTPAFDSALKELLQRALDSKRAIRCGAVTVHSLGTPRLDTSSSSCCFHTRQYIYPHRFRASRIFYSMVRRLVRTLYLFEIFHLNDFDPGDAAEAKYIAASIAAVDGRPDSDSGQNRPNPIAEERPIFRAVAMDCASRPLYSQNLRALHRCILQQVHNCNAERASSFPDSSYGTTAHQFFGLGLPIVRRAIETMSESVAAMFRCGPSGLKREIYLPSCRLPTAEDARKIQLTQAALIMNRAASKSGSARGDPLKDRVAVDSIRVKRRMLTKVTDQDDTELLEELRRNSSRGVGGGEDDDEIERRADQERDSREACRREIESNRLKYLELARQYQQDSTAKFEVKKSRIHGWGLYAKIAFERHDMIVEYIGEKVRVAVADRREVQYEQEGVGSCYLFRLDKDFIVDATRTGGMARFINHCCEPNAYARTISVPVEGTDLEEKHIIIMADRDIHEGEEITYDYKFPLEDKKLKCYCGAAKCNGTMN